MVHWNNRGKKSIVWRCVSRLENTGLACNSRTVLEDLLKDAVVKAINDLLGQKDDLLEVLRNNIETVINEQLIRRLIGKIMVYEDKFTIEFKSGVEVEVEM